MRRWGACRMKALDEHEPAALVFHATSMTISTGDQPNGIPVYAHHASPVFQVVEDQRNRRTRCVNPYHLRTPSISHVRAPTGDQQRSVASGSGRLLPAVKRQNMHSSSVRFCVKRAGDGCGHSPYSAAVSEMPSRRELRHVFSSGNGT